jgi:hypothetical protein
MVAEDRDIDADLFGGVHDQGTFRHADLHAIYAQCDLFRHKYSVVKRNP